MCVLESVRRAICCYIGMYELFTDKDPHPEHKGIWCISHAGGYRGYARHSYSSSPFLISSSTTLSRWTDV